MIGWPTVAEHARNRIAALQTRLETVSNGDLPAVQASIKAWREVLDLPNTLQPRRLEGDGSGYL